MDLKVTSFRLEDSANRKVGRGELRRIAELEELLARLDGDSLVSVFLQSRDWAYLCIAGGLSGSFCCQFVDNERGVLRSLVAESTKSSASHEVAIALQKPGDTMDVPGRNVVPLAVALDVAKHFVTTGELHGGYVWE